MKVMLVILLVVFSGIASNAQNRLENTYSSYSEVYGGTPDGGISRTESYTFKAKRPVDLKTILLDNKPLRLKKGEIIIVNVHKHIPYNKQEPVETIETPPISTETVQMKAVQMKGVYYLNINYPYEWTGTIEYISKKKTHTVHTKTEFDKGYTGYAP